MTIYNDERGKNAGRKVTISKKAKDNLSASQKAKSPAKKSGHVGTGGGKLGMGMPKVTSRAYDKKGK